MSFKKISLTSAENIIHGAGHACAIDAPLNRHLIISWWVAATPGRTLDAQREVLQLASKWLKYRGVTPAYAWAIENGPKLRNHSHILIHVPDEHQLQFRKMVNHWVKRVGGAPSNKGAIRIPRKKSYQTYDQMIRKLLQYILKGLDLQAAELLGITPDYESAGAVIGKRCGTSQSIGPKARAEHANQAA
jgi:hypothetical protein